VDAALNDTKSSKQANVPEQRLSMWEKLSFASGSIGNNLVFAVISSYLMIFYTDSMGISAAVAGTIFLVARIWDALIDPFVGMVADNTRSRWGRFRPYLLFVPIPMGIITALCFTVPGFDSGGTIVYAFITYILWGTLFALMDIPYWSMTAAITTNTNERSTVVALPRAASAIANLAVGAATIPLVKVFGGGNDAQGYQATAVLFAVLCVVFSWIAFFNTRERTTIGSSHKVSFVDLKKAITSNSPLLLAMTVGVVVSIAAMLRNNLTMYYFTYYLGSVDIVPAFMMASMAGLFVGMTCAPAFAKSFGKKLTAVWGCLFFCIFGAVPYFLSPSDIVWIIAFSALGNLGAGIIMVIQTSMMGDTVEYGEWQTGRRMEGVNFSLNMLATKVGLAISGAAAGYALTFIGFVPNAAQSPSTLANLNLLMMIVPSVLGLFMLIPVYFYKLDEKKHAAIMADIEARKRKETPGLNQ